MCKTVAGMNAFLRIPENRDPVVVVDPFHIVFDYTPDSASQPGILYNIQDIYKEM